MHKIEAFREKWPPTGLLIEKEGLGFFPVLVMYRSVSQTSYSTLLQSTQQQWVPGAQIQDWINSCILL